MRSRVRALAVALALAVSGLCATQPAAADPVICTSIGTQQVPISTTAQLVVPVAGKTIYLCGFFFSATAATTAQIIQGTGATCGTGQTAVTTTLPIATAIAFNQTIGILQPLVAGNGLCVTAGTVAVAAIVSYAQF